jgi:hypothetical protein
MGLMLFSIRLAIAPACVRKTPAASPHSTPHVMITIGTNSQKMGNEIVTPAAHNLLRIHKYRIISGC